MGGWKSRSGCRSPFKKRSSRSRSGPLCVQQEGKGSFSQCRPLYLPWKWRRLVRIAQLCQARVRTVSAPGVGRLPVIEAGAHRQARPRPRDAVRWKRRSWRDVWTMNCYSAYLKAELANRKTNKVWLRDFTIISSLDVNAQCSVCHSLCYGKVRLLHETRLMRGLLPCSIFLLVSKCFKRIGGLPKPRRRKSFKRSYMHCIGAQCPCRLTYFKCIKLFLTQIRMSNIAVSAWNWNRTEDRINKYTDEARI